MVPGACLCKLCRAENEIHCWLFKLGVVLPLWPSANLSPGCSNDIHRFTLVMIFIEHHLKILISIYTPAPFIDMSFTDISIL